MVLPSGVYEALLLLPSSAYDPEICRDLARTFPDHAFFNDSDGEGQRALFNVLHAYAVFDPSVGYCQGMGFVVGLMLTYMSEEVRLRRAPGPTTGPHGYNLLLCLACLCPALRRRFGPPLPS